MKPTISRAFLISLGIHFFSLLLIAACFFIWPKSVQRFTAVEFDSIGSAIHPQIGLKKSTDKPEIPLMTNQRIVTGDGSGLKGEQESYLSQLRQQIKNHQIYPVLAQKKGLQGVVKIRLEIDNQGNAISIKATEGANLAENSPILIKAALDSVSLASPFPPPPAEISRIFEIPIQFHLRE